MRTTSSPAICPADRGLPLTVVEVGRDRDDRFLDLPPDRLLGPVLEGPQDHGRDLLRPVLLVGEPDLHVLAHLPLDRFHRAVRGERVLVAGRLADQEPPIVGQPDERRKDRVAVIPGQDARGAVLNNGHLGVRGAQVDAQNQLGHERASSMQDGRG
jgi:hypothetical protein